MKRAAFLGFALILASVALLAQGDQAPGYSITFLMDKKDANQVWGTSAFFPDRSFSEIWTATIKKLIVDHKRILVADMASGFLSGEDHFGDVQYFIAERPGGVEVIFPSAGGQKSIEKIARQVCEAILEQLTKIQ